MLSLSKPEYWCLVERHESLRIESTRSSKSVRLRHGTPHGGSARGRNVDGNANSPRLPGISCIPPGPETTWIDLSGSNTKYYVDPYMHPDLNCFAYFSCFLIILYQQTNLKFDQLKHSSRMSSHRDPPVGRCLWNGNLVSRFFHHRSMTVPRCSFSGFS